MPRSSIRAQLAKLNGHEKPPAAKAPHPGQPPYAVVSDDELPASLRATRDTDFAEKAQRAAERAAHAAQPPGIHYLYRLYNAGRELLYIGITDNPPRRWKEHRSAAGWWSQVEAANTVLETYASRAAADQAERAAVPLETPRYNKTYVSPRRKRR